jgi:hypothetical protein
MALLQSNTKLKKTAGPAADYLVAGLTLSPGNISGHEVCVARGKCFHACVGHQAGLRIQAAARAKARRDTRALFDDRPAFLTRLRGEIARHVKKADKYGLTALIRLNVASDLDWTVFVAEFPGLTFYDYTKVRSRYRAYLAGKLPPNYHLTFSASEESHGATLRSFLSAGGNVAQVYDVDYYPAVGRIGDLPEIQRYHGREFPVISGDEHDIRIPAVDGSGNVVGLRLKAAKNAVKAAARKTGFVI